MATKCKKTLINTQLIKANNIKINKNISELLLFFFFEEKKTTVEVIINTSHVF